MQNDNDELDQQLREIKRQLRWYSMTHRQKVAWVKREFGWLAEAKKEKPKKEQKQKLIHSIQIDTKAGKVAWEKAKNEKELSQSERVSAIFYLDSQGPIPDIELMRVFNINLNQLWQDLHIVRERYAELCEEFAPGELIQILRLPMNKQKAKETTKG